MTNVELETPSLWERFHVLGNEMIVNNKGRRIFPTIKVKVTNLEENELYSLSINFVRKGSKKFANGQWLPSDRNTSSDFDEELTEAFVHPNSPHYGIHWIENHVDFSKLKVTNKREHKKDHIYLDTFYEYVPRISIYKILRLVSNDKKEFVSSFDFEKASFIAVTTYQNEELKNLKVAHNPYAKGQKRKHQTEDDEPVPKQYFAENSNGSQPVKRNSYQKFDNPHHSQIDRQFSENIENNIQHYMPQTTYDPHLWYTNNSLYTGHLDGQLHNLTYNPIFGYAGSQHLGLESYQSIYPDPHLHPTTSSPSSTTTTNTSFGFPIINPCTQELNEDYQHQQFKEFHNFKINGLQPNYYNQRQ